MADLEEIACNALRSILLVRKKAVYSIDRRPDKENRNSQDIDFILSCEGKPPLAVEHTSLESFEGQREIGAVHVAFVAEVAKSLNIPNTTYFKLCCPIGMYRQLSKKRRQSLICEISEWIVVSLEKLQPHGRMIQLSIESGQYRVWLGRGGSHPNLNGQLLPTLIAPTLLDRERNVRVNRALASKLPKLALYQQRGMHTYLLLEDWDISLSNSQLVKDEVLRLRHKYTDILPFSIVQLTSYQDRIVEAWILKEDGKWASRIWNRGPFYDFEP